jgi:hypothetical protein
MKDQTLDIQVHYCNSNDTYDALICPICFNMPNRSKQFPCCKASICSLCAKTWLKQSSACPFCRSEIDAYNQKKGIPDNAENQKILQVLDVICPFSARGCKWTGKRKALHKHMKLQCTYFKGIQFVDLIEKMQKIAVKYGCPNSDS